MGRVDEEVIINTRKQIVKWQVVEVGWTDHHTRWEIKVNRAGGSRTSPFANERYNWTDNVREQMVSE